MAVVCLHAQNIVTVRDAQTLRVLENVVITNADKTASVTTNAKGQADISALGNGDLTLILAGYQPLTLSAQNIKDLNYEVKLLQSTMDLNEIVVSASKFEEKKVDVAQPILVISDEVIRTANAQNTGDLLMQTGGVFVQKSQLGGSSPVLRGFEASRVLLVVDGIRMNNAIYRSGHLQNIITVDQNMLERMEVVFGPGSVVYGSDALGGVIHMHSRKPVLSPDDKLLVKGNAFTRYSTANQEKTGHIDFNIGLKKFASLTSFTYSDFGDLRMGNIRNPFHGNWGKRLIYQTRIDGKDTALKNDDFNIQIGSAYKQYDLTQKIRFDQNSAISHMLNFQYSTSSDVPRYDRLSEITSGGQPRFAEWYYGPQKRLLGAYHLNLSNANPVYDQARFILSYQDIEESRHTRNFKNNNKTSRIENVKVFALNADLVKKIQNHEVRYGLEGVHNIVASRAERVNIATGVKSPASTRYPDGGSTVTSIAAYATHAWEINEKFVTNAGVRFSHVDLSAKFDDKDNIMKFPFKTAEQVNNALTGNIGLIYKPIPSLRISTLFSSGFRSPNVDDLGKVFDSNSANRLVVVPNPDLKPEYTYNAELGIQKTFDNDKVKLSLIGFYTIFDNAIVLDNFKFNGQDSIIYDGVLCKVQANQNKNEAYLYGGTFTVAGDITKAFSVFGTVTYTYGRVRPQKPGDKEVPLDHIPPVYGRVGFQLNLNRFKGEFFTLFNGPKLLRDYSPVGEDNLQYATPNGMPGWFTLNIRTQYQVYKYVNLQAGLENILDTHYRHFASGISAPGRNLYLAVRANF
ncbi:MAG: TonB-dependent receptor [Bacteroidia bacterium]|nr:TonB-dependent receptor [Bacteroidia bacterium]